MIVNYIDIDFNGNDTQKEFNHAVAMAISSAKANPSVISKVRIVSKDGNDNMGLLEAFHEFNENTSKDEFKLAYSIGSLNMVGLKKPSDDEAKSYIYIVSWNQVWDFAEISNSNKAFYSMSEAIEFFLDFKKDELESIKEHGSNDWIESDDNYLDYESGNASWEFYKDGEYSSNHSCIYIDKKAIE